MKFKVLNKEIIYKGCPIVIRQAEEDEEHFEYFTCINNQIWSAVVKSRKPILRRILCQKFTPEELVAIMNRVIAMAETTIDEFLQPAV